MDETSLLINILLRSDPYQSNQTIENRNGTKIMENRKDKEHTIIFTAPSSYTELKKSLSGANLRTSCLIVDEFILYLGIKPVENAAHKI
jgi:hypothetical protein